jgi:haloacetate dehalogenase
MLAGDPCARVDSVGARMPEFESSIIDADETAIHVECGGSGPAVLLLHGFPETLAMWREIASLLAGRFSVVCADLRGYGASGCPPSARAHAPYSKRALACDMVAVMTQLGFERFSIAGHDRGGRVAYRAALDAPERVERLAVLDVVPIDTAWDRADDRLALGFWPWSLLAQPEPLPERLVGGAPEAVIDHALSMEWGTPADTFDKDTRANYLSQLQDPDHVHAICEEYRAAAGIDREHDRADRTAGRRIACPVLVLWSGAGPLASWYTDDGGPLEEWRKLAPNVTGHPVEGGHFFPEEHPRETAEALAAFFSLEGD